MFVHECSHFAGIIGTTTHFSLFAQKNTEIIVLNKQIELNRFQFMIDNMKGYKVTYIDSYLSLFPVHWTGPFLHTVTDNLISFAKDNNMRPPRKCADFDAIKKYLLLYFKQRKIFDDQLSSLYRENSYFLKELYDIVHDDFLHQLEDEDYDSLGFLLQRWGKNKIKQIYRKALPGNIRKIIRGLRG